MVFRRSRRYGRRFRRRGRSGMRGRRVFRRRFRRGGRRRVPFGGAALQRGIKYKHVENRTVTITPGGAGTAAPLPLQFTWDAASMIDTTWFPRMAAVFEYYQLRGVSLKFYRPWITTDPGTYSTTETPHIQLHTAPNYNTTDQATTVDQIQDRQGYKSVLLTSNLLSGGYVKRFIRPRTQDYVLDTTFTTGYIPGRRNMWISTSDPEPNFYGLDAVIEPIAREGTMNQWAGYAQFRIEVTYRFAFKGRTSIAR